MGNDSRIADGGRTVESPSSAFVREWTRSQDGILAFICSLVANFSEAEDLLQETATRAFSNSHRYDPERPFLPWAIGIARHVVLDQRRRGSQEFRLLDDDLILGLAEAFERTCESGDSRFKALTECRERLAGRSRDVLRLRYDEDLSPTQIAAIVGQTPGMIRALLHRVRQQLRHCIEQRLRAEGAVS